MVLRKSTFLHKMFVTHNMLLHKFKTVQSNAFFILFQLQGLRYIETLAKIVSYT